MFLIFYGDLQSKIDTELAKGLNEDEIFDKHLHHLEKEIKMNQISPKMFEAISLKTALVLFEGEYSGILKPNRHFIPLKKDFSNFEEVVIKLNDDHYLQEMVDRAFEEICLNEKYSYNYFIRSVFDQVIDDEVSIIKPKEHDIVFGFVERNISIQGTMTTKYFERKRKVSPGPTVTFQESSDYHNTIEIKNLLGFELKRRIRNLGLNVLEFFPKGLVKLVLLLQVSFKFANNFLIRIIKLSIRIFGKLKRMIKALG